MSRVPGEGGASWHRLESKHFILSTDQSEQRGRATITYFERLLDAYYQLGWEAHGELPTKVEVVVLDDHGDFDVFGKREVAGYTVRVPLFEPLIVTPSVRRFQSYRTLNHELTHFIADQSLQFQPPWLAEGLAVYFETAHFERTQRFDVGVEPSDRVDVLLRTGRLSARQLMAANEVQLTPRFYASAWLVVHYLMSTRADDFVRFQDRLDEGMPPSAAWAAAFPDLPLERLDTALDRYLAGKRFQYSSRPLKAFRVPAIASSTLDDADVYALRARLFSGCLRCDPSEREHALADNIERALQADPQNLLASVLHIQWLPAALRLSPSEALVREHPEAWRAWCVLASAQLSQGARRCTPEVMSHLRQIGAHVASALMMSAACEAAAGNTSDALALSARSLRLGPTETPLLLARAEMLFELHACAELQQLMPRVRAASHVKLDPEMLERWSHCGD